MKTIIISIPKGTENVRLIKDWQLDDGFSIHVIDDEDTFRDSKDNKLDNSKVFFCFQNKVKVRFDPFLYSCIETTSNHYARLHPIDKTQPILDIYVKSLDNLLEQLKTHGVDIFWRVNNSYAVNYHVIKEYKKGMIYIPGKMSHVSVSTQYKKIIDNKICTIHY